MKMVLTLNVSLVVCLDKAVVPLGLSYIFSLGPDFLSHETFSLVERNSQN